MELDLLQPSVALLADRLAPWFDHPSAWLVLLCTPLYAFMAGIAPLADALLAWRAARLPELRPERRNAWRWLAAALLVQLAATWAGPATSRLLELAFFACVALAATGFLRSTRDRAFGPQF